MMNINNSIKKEFGVRNGELLALSKKPNSVSSQAQDASKKVKALSYSNTANEQMEKVLSVITNMSGAEVLQKTDNYLYAVFTTKILRFKDDVEIYLDEASKLLHFRSASRLGYSDLGVNRKRYDAFVEALTNC